MMEGWEFKEKQNSKQGFGIKNEDDGKVRPIIVKFSL